MLSALSEAAFRVVVKMLEIWSMPIARIGRVDGRTSIEWFPKIEDSSIDSRILKIDEARNSLASALSAIDELKTSAESNRAELHAIRRELEQAAAHKASAEHELEAVKKMAAADVEVFRRVVGIPSRRDIGKERLIGFVIGVLASLVATFIWWLVKH
jgi:hypothetical protein